MVKWEKKRRWTLGDVLVILAFLRAGGRTCSVSVHPWGLCFLACEKEEVAIGDVQSPVQLSPHL